MGDRRRGMFCKAAHVGLEGGNTTTELPLRFVLDAICFLAKLGAKWGKIEDGLEALCHFS